MWFHQVFVWETSSLCCPGDVDCLHIVGCRERWGRVASPYMEMGGVRSANVHQYPLHSFLPPSYAHITPSHTLTPSYPRTHSSHPSTLCHHILIYSHPILPPSHPPSHPHLQILREIEEHKIRIYQFPDMEGDAEEAAANKKLRVCIVTGYTTTNFTHPPPPSPFPSLLPPLLPLLLPPSSFPPPPRRPSPLQW